MPSRQTINPAVETLYLKQCKKALSLEPGGQIFLGLLFGVGFGTLSFSLFGTAFYLILMIIGAVISGKARECRKMNENDPRLLLYSSVLSFILILQLSDMGFMLLTFLFFPSPSALRYLDPFSLYFAGAFGVYLIYIFIVFSLVFILAKIKFDPQKYQLEKYTKGKYAKIGAIGGGAGGAIGLLLSKIFRPGPILFIIIWILVVFLDILSFSFIAHYILMYRALKKEAAEAQEP